MFAVWLQTFYQFIHQDMKTSRSILVPVIAVLLSVLVPVNLSANAKERFFQFGLFPPISSNGTNSGKTVNSVSINLLGGYSAGTRIFELGGIWNASREYTKGLQIAGLMNVGGHVNGLQLSALVNVAKSVNGVQIGLVNYMGNGENGVSIGLINIAKHGGKYEFEVSFSDAINTLLSFRLGTDRFYTIFSGGVNYFFSPLEYAVGLGFGTSIDWKKRWSNQIEIQAFGISNEQKLTTNGTINSIIQLRLPVCKEFAKHFKVFAGPAINLALQGTGTDGTALPSPAPWTMWKGQWEDMQAEGWIGLSAGLRF